MSAPTPRTIRKSATILSSKSGQPRPKVIAIVGATGSGKSALALRLARRFDGVIIAADSRTIYRGLDIGTAKPTRVERRTVPHYGLDLVRPTLRYSAAQYQRYVYQLVKRLHRQDPGRPIFLVGGTMLYIDAVLKGLDFSAVPPNAALRARLERQPIAALLQRLARVDPTTAERIDRHNRRRLVRALEVALTTRRSFYGARNAAPPAWDVLVLGTRVAPRTLARWQRSRVDRMFGAGWAAEVRRLLRHIRGDAPGLSALGYAEVVEYAKGLRTLLQTKTTILAKTRRLARRQQAWFRKNAQIVWLAPNSHRAGSLVEIFLK